jgi:pectate lyase
MTTGTAGAMIYTAAAMRYRSHEDTEGFVERAEFHHGSSNGSRAGVAVLDSIVGSPGSHLVEGEFSGRVDWAVVAVAIRAGSPGGPVHNLAPLVDAGEDQQSELGSAVTLNGAVTDDGLPSNPATLTIQWTQLSGPGVVSFDDALNLSTSVQFPTPGFYELALAAFDGELTSVDDIAVEIVEAPEPGLVSFPGAVGFGRYATGGRGGDVYRVINLNDSGPGSLRYGVEEQSGARTVVFAVSGYIDLVTQISIENPDITIAGQTSPGGITLRGARLKLKAGNVIVRGMRFRPGDGPIGQEARNRDGWSIGDSTITVKDVIFDHCSATWAQDENGSNYYLSENVTIQRCLFAECLPASSGAPNGFGYLLVTAPNSTFFQNAFFSNADRNPKIRSLNVEVINNLGYNWKASGLGVSDSLSSTVHGINNYYVHGPDSLDRPAFYLKENGAGDQSIYLVGNIDNRFRPDAGQGDEWDVAHGYASAMRSDGPVFEPSGVSAIPAEQVLALVLAEVGAITPERDSIDQRILNTLTTDTGAFLLSQNDVGGYPPVVSLPVLADSDLDGMPDTWENTNGLDSADPADRNGLHSSGYTFLEAYINALIPGESEIAGLETLSISPRLAEDGNSWSDSSIEKRDLKVVIEGEVVGISFSSYEGESCQVFTSSDLETWMPFGERMVGTGDIVETRIPFDRAQSRFFKVERVGGGFDLRK